MRARLTSIICLTAVTAIVLSGCGGSSSAATDTLDVALNSDPSSFDPAKARTADDYFVSRLLYDSLLRRDDENKLVGGLASSWEEIDAAHYRFTIKPGASCSDGTPITATVVADSVSRFLDPETASPGRTLALGGAKATASADDAAGVVSVALSEPWADLPAGLALPHSGIVCPAGLADPQGLAAGAVPGAFSGPYNLANAQAAVSYELALREDYGNWPSFAKPLTGTPAKTLTLTPIDDSGTIATQLLAGSLDVAALMGEEVSRVDNGSFGVQSAPSSTSYLIFNEREGSVFANPDLRRRVAGLLDREAFVDILSAGRGEPIASVASPGIACVNTDFGVLQPVQAPTGGELAGVNIHLAGTVQFAPANEYVGEVLRKAGANVKVDSLDNANWSSVTTSAGGWDLTIQGDINILGTLTSSLLRVMGPPADQGGRNKMGVVNETGYAALREALSTSDATARCDAFGRAQRSMLDRVDVVPLTSLPQSVITAEGANVRVFGDYIDPATLRIGE